MRDLFTFNLLRIIDFLILGFEIIYCSYNIVVRFIFLLYCFNIFVKWFMFLHRRGAKTQRCKDFLDVFAIHVSSKQKRKREVYSISIYLCSSFHLSYCLVNKVLEFRRYFTMNNRVHLQHQNCHHILFRVDPEMSMKIAAPPVIAN